jgi:hypothetical protein
MGDKWNVSMEGEKDSTRTTLPDGDHTVAIKEVKLVSAEESKSGNPYFLWTLATDEGDLDVVTTLIKGKRWLLKQMLSACGIEAKEKDPEQKYSFEPDDVINKTVVIQIKNVTNTFTGRDGNEITFDKSEVKRVKSYKKGTAESSI